MEAVPRRGVLIVPWPVRRVVATAGEFHHRDLPSGRVAWRVEIPAPVVVLGSRQDATMLNERECIRQGLDVVRRRSGGGLVVLRPHEHVWVDLVIGRDDPLWDDDVTRSSWWLGKAWCDAISTLGVAGAVVHRDSLVADDWGQRICFAGVGPGEVVDADGRKVVGMAQRRARGVARFQCTLYQRWSAREHELLVANPPDGSVDGRVRCVERPADVVVDAFLTALDQY